MNQKKVLIPVAIIFLFVLGFISYKLTVQKKQETRTRVVTQTSQPAQVKTVEVPKTQEVAKTNISGIHPILNDVGLVLGGTVDGKWMNSAQISKLIKGGEKYRLYEKGKYIGERTGQKPKEQEYISGEKGYKVNFNQSNNESIYGFGLLGNWNAQVRSVKTENKSLEKYKKVVKEVLDKSGFKYKETVVNEVKKADLDGDGSDESLIIASNITEKDMDSNDDGESKHFEGKYSLLILQKIKNGKEVNTIVEQRFDQGNLMEIPFVGDMDGDGQMEFIARAVDVQVVPVEGWAFVEEYIYKMNDYGVEKKSSIFYHPI